MKYLFLLMLFFFAAPNLFAQDTGNIDNNAVSAAQQYEEDDYDLDFKVVFSSQDDLEDFKKLRTYLRKKENLKNSLLGMLTDISAQDTTELNAHLKYANNQIPYARENGYLSNFHIEIKTESGKQVFSSRDNMVDEDFLTTVVIPTIESTKSRITAILNANKTLKSNIAKIDQDIASCEEQIDVSLAPEYKDQEFRARISLYFSGMIAILLLGFFIIIGFKSDKNIGKEFLGDHGLQFITMFVLIIAVILFGILGILEGRELTAILSGVSGYILGKGTGLVRKDPGALPPRDPVPVDPTPTPVEPAPIYSSEPVISAPESFEEYDPTEEISNSEFPDEDLDDEEAVG